MDTLTEVKSYMNFWGWTNSGNPGSVKLDVDGKVIASYGGIEWLSDVERACETIKRLADHAHN